MPIQSRDNYLSIFEVWDNITEQQVAELEGLFRHIYRNDSRANRLNVQRSFAVLERLRNDDLTIWRRAI
jgi:hypothetical protein